jgi:hypothetical protein
MYFVLFVLHNPDLCEDVLNAWEEAGVHGVTILPSTGLNRIQKRALLEDMPLMPSLEDFFSTHEDGNRTMFTILQGDQLIDPIVAATEKVVGKLDEPETGILIVLPVIRAFGLQKNYQ